MKPYRSERKRQDRRSTVTGLLSTVLVHAALVAVGLTAGLKYLDPPPPETSFLVNFREELPEEPVPTEVGEEPQSEELDPENPVELTREIAAHPKDTYEIGQEWCKAQCRDLLAHGYEEIHFYTMGRSDNIINVLRDCF